MIIAALVVVYLIAIWAGWPQATTTKIVAQEQSQSGAMNHDQPAPPPLYTIIPFVLLLAAIAVLPLLPATAHRWESNLYRFYVAAALAAISLAYYLFLHPTPIVGHFPTPHLSWTIDGETLHWGTVGDLLANALLQEYLPFIVLLFSLFTICGGIRIEGDLRARALTNTAFLGDRRGAGQLHRHHRRGDGADSPAVAHQPRAEARRAYGRVFHLHRLQLRRMPVAAGRSAAVSRLPAGRAVPVDADAVERVAIAQRPAVGDLLPVGSLLFPPPRSAARYRPR